MKKILLEFSEIEEKLEKLFLDIPKNLKSELTDLKLKKSNLSLEDISILERSLNIKLPIVFKQMILMYDFGDLTLGGVNFGNKENYIKYLLKKNVNRIRDKSFLKYIEIADTDGYIVLLNTEKEKIHAYSRTKSCNDAEIVASDFKRFVQAAATIHIKFQLNDNDSSLYEIPYIVGSLAKNDFWIEIL